jgi:hypothetical protein
MVLSTLSFQGIGSAEAAYHILYNENLVNKYINNILITLRRKDLYGVNFIYSYLISTNTDIYNKFTEKITQRLNEGTENVLCRVKENKSIANVDYIQHLQCFFGIIIVSNIGGGTRGRTTTEIDIKSIYRYL